MDLEAIIRSIVVALIAGGVASLIGVWANQKLFKRIILEFDEHRKDKDIHVPKEVINTKFKAVNDKLAKLNNRA